MSVRIHHIMVVVLVSVLIPLAAGADVLHLKNGKALKVEKAWQDSDQIYFVLQGLKACIPQSKVASIESGSGRGTESGDAASQTQADLNQTASGSSEDLVPTQINQPTNSDSAAQLQPEPPGKTLVLGTNGFNGLKWGIRRSDLKGLEQRQTDSGLDEVIEYVRPADTLKLGQADLKTVIYAFWRDQLYTVTLWTQGPENYQALRDAAFSRFGKGARIDEDGEKFLWSQDPTDAMLKYDKESQYGMLWMRSSEINRKIKLAKLSSPTSYLKWMKSRN